jgi:putative ABC transport system permease protein
MNLKYAARTLARSPGFTATAILTLALGIGATTAMMTIVNSVLFKPLPFKDPDRLYTALTDIRRPGSAVGPMLGAPVNARSFNEWRAHCNACDDVAMVSGDGFTLSGRGAPERVFAFDVSFNFFRTLGLQPQVGRDFQPGDEGPAGSRVVILSDTLWRARFNADRSVVGSSLLVDGVPCTVIGVMPPAMMLPRGEQWGPFFGHQADPAIFKPFAIDMPRSRTVGQWNYYTVVRLKSGESSATAAAQMTAAIGQFSRDAGLEMSASLVPLADRVAGDSPRKLWMLVGAIVAVLALVGLNLGGLMLARSIGRSRDIGIRRALGASRADVFGDILGEIAALAAIAGAAATAVAAVAVRAFVAAAPIDIPRLQEVRTDWHVLIFSLGASAFAALVASAAPAWRLLRGDLTTSLSGSTRSATDSKSRILALDAVMTIEVALGTVVLITAALLSESFMRVLQADRGFQTANVITETVPLPAISYGTPDARTAFIRDALPAFAGIPGVKSVAETSQIPLLGETWTDGLVDADHPDNDRIAAAPVTNRRFVSPGYIATMGIPLIAGRDLSDGDRERPVALISQRAADLLWPGQSAVGRHVLGSGTAAVAGRVPEEVVGVVADVRTNGLDRAVVPIVYEAYWRAGPGRPQFVFRTDRDTASLAAGVREVMNQLDPGLPVAPLRTMSSIVDASAAPRRFQARLIGAFALAATMIAAMGLYGLVSFSVSRRTREIGMRIALGAPPSSIAGLVLAQGLRPVVIGAAAGMIAAVFARAALADLLYGTSARDPVTFAFVGVALLAVAMAACAVPARRAIAVDPVISLRAE